MQKHILSKGSTRIFGAGVRIFVARPSSFMPSSTGSENAKKYIPNLRVPFYAGSANKPSMAAGWFTGLHRINPNKVLCPKMMSYPEKKLGASSFSHKNAIVFHNSPYFFPMEMDKTVRSTLHRSAWEHEGGHLRAMIWSLLLWPYGWICWVNSCDILCITNIDRAGYCEYTCKYTYIYIEREIIHISPWYHGTYLIIRFSDNWHIDVCCHMLSHAPSGQTQAVSPKGSEFTESKERLAASRNKWTPPARTSQCHCNATAFQVQSDWFGVSTVDKSAANGSACWCWHSLLIGCPDALPGSSHVGNGPFPLVPKFCRTSCLVQNCPQRHGDWLKFGCWIFHGFSHSSELKNRHGISRPAWLPHWALQARCDWTRQSIPTWASFGKSSTLWWFNTAMGNGPFLDVLPIKNGNFHSSIRLPWGAYTAICPLSYLFTIEWI